MNAHESGPPDDAASPGRGAEHDSPGRGLQPEAGPGDEIAGPGADHVDGVRSGNGAALGSDPASEPDPVPGWIADLVPVADDARAILLADRVVLAAGVPLALVLGWAGARRDVGHLPIWAGALMAAAAAAVVLRPGRAAAAPDLRAGGRTGVVLIVLDIVLTAIGLALLVGLVAAGLIPSPVAIADVVSFPTNDSLRGPDGAGALLLLGRLLRARWRIVLALAIVVAAGVAAPAVRAWPADPSWWALAALAVGVDVVCLLALRVGTVRDRRLLARD